MRFVVGCDLAEFKEYYRRNGFAGEQGTENLESQKKKSLLKTQLTLLCGERTMRLLVMQSGMRLALMSIEEEILETERTEKY